MFLKWQSLLTGLLTIKISFGQIVWAFIYTTLLIDRYCFKYFGSRIIYVRWNRAGISRWWFNHALMMFRTCSIDFHQHLHICSSFGKYQKLTKTYWSITILCTGQAFKFLTNNNDAKMPEIHKFFQYHKTYYFSSKPTT